MRKIQTSLGILPESQLTLQEDGNIFVAYLPDTVDGKYVPDMDKVNEAIELEAKEKAKVIKYKAIDDLVITHNTVAYDADGKSIGNMSAVMGVANFKFNQAITQGIAVDEAYNFVYKESKIWWKGADDKPHEVMIESVCEALEKSMLGVADILGV